MKLFKKRKGMEMVQVAILVAIAIILGLIFKTEISNFVTKTLESAVMLGEQKKTQNFRKIAGENISYGDEIIE